MSALIRYQIEHVTRYLHAGTTSTSQHIAHLRPRETARQQVVSHVLEIDPPAVDVVERTDYFGNRVHQFSILSPYEALEVTSRAAVLIEPAATLVDLDATWPWEAARDRWHPSHPAGFDPAVEFTFASPYVTLAEELRSFALDVFTPRRPVGAAALALMQRIHEEFTFDPNATDITTPVSQVLVDRRGVCQDFAHVQIACLRSLGLAARYVSGYLLTDPPPGQPRLMGADASHAWLSVYCPRFGWIDFDPTNALVPDERHITLAWGRDYGDVSPLRGVVLGGDHQTLQVGVSVVPMTGLSMHGR